MYIYIYLSCPVVLFLTFFSQRHVGLTLSTFSRYSGHLFVQVEKSPRHATAIYEFQWPQRSIAGKVFEELFLWSVLDIEHCWLLKISASVEPGSLPKLLRISNSKRWPQINRDYAGRYWTVSLYTISFRGRRKQEENFNEVARHSMPLLGQSFLATAFSSIRCDVPKKITVSSDFCGYGTAVSLPSLNIIMALKQIYLGMH